MTYLAKALGLFGVGVSRRSESMENRVVWASPTGGSGGGGAGGGVAVSHRTPFPELHCYISLPPDGIFCTAFSSLHWRRTLNYSQCHDFTQTEVMAFRRRPRTITHYTWT